jgi:hypothetical protein
MIFWLRFFFVQEKTGIQSYANKKIHHLSKSNVDIEPRHYTSALKDLTLPERKKTDKKVPQMLHDYNQTQK